MSVFHGADFLSLFIPQRCAVLDWVHPGEMGVDTHRTNCGHSGESTYLSALE